MYGIIKFFEVIENSNAASVRKKGESSPLRSGRCKILRN